MTEPEKDLEVETLSVEGDFQVTWIHVCGQMGAQEPCTYDGESWTQVLDRPSPQVVLQVFPMCPETGHALQRVETVRPS